jgi:copper chaperone CopZ
MSEPRATGIFQLVGLDCASCVPIVSKELHRMKGVLDVRANVITGKVSVDFDPALTDAIAIKTAIEHAGYKVAMAAGRLR